MTELMSRILLGPESPFIDQETVVLRSMIVSRTMRVVVATISKLSGYERTPAAVRVRGTCLNGPI